MSDKLLSITGLSAGYGPLRVLHEIDFSVAAGETLGLVGLRERAYLLGGEVAFISAPGRGTNIEVRLPVSSMPFPP